MPSCLFPSRVFCAGVAVYGLVSAVHAQTASPAAPAPAPAPVTTEVPFDFSQGVPLLEVDLGGSRLARLVLDTGNNLSILDVEAAKELSLPLLESDKQTAGSGAKAFTYYRVTPPKFRLGATELSVNRMVVTPVREALQKQGVTCDGTLGYAALKDRVVQIDYPARRLRLLDAADATAAATRGQAIAITWKKYWSGSPDLVTVDDLQIEGHRLCAQLDTFYRHTAILFSTKLPWLKTDPAPGVAAVKYEEAELAPARVPGGLALGACRLDAGTPVYVAGADAHIPETELCVVLGTGFFRQSVVTLDYPASRLIVEPSSK